jgi:DNA invertase Pin-like site-specific DNA recombinase
MGHSSRADVRCEGSDGQVVEVEEGGRDTTNQLEEIRQYVSRRRWELARQYTDYALGEHVDCNAFRRLLEDASKRFFDIVLVWALDRFTHEGVLKAFEYVCELRRFGVHIESYSEPHFRTTGRAWERMLPVVA